MRNWGLAGIKAQGAWSAGATGQGIKVAVIDTGVDTTAFDLTGRVSADSIDIVTGRPAGTTVDRHATYVAGIIAGNFNNAGAVGVAYNADILSLRVDSSGSCATECTFSTIDIATGIDYAISHGAKVINLSLGTDTAAPQHLQAALKRATDAGIIVVTAAGNDGLPEPGWPARYATHPSYNGLIVAVGAVAEDGVTLASFSNKAGGAPNGYIVAPGERVVTDCDGVGSCWRVSGTSFATPHVSGAAALLLQGFPNLSGRDVVDILLRTATDLGATGTDAVFGRGLLNVARAFQPLGALSLPTAGGGALIADAAQGTMLSPAFGDALLGSQALSTVGYDDYQRLFRVDLGAAYRAAGQRSLAPAAGALTTRAGADLAVAGGARLRIASQQAVVDAVESPFNLLRPPAPEAVAVSYTDGALRFDAWSGRGGMAPTFQGAPADAFTALAQADQAVRAGYARGDWTFSAEQGLGGPGDYSPLALTLDRRPGEDRSSYLRWTVSRASERGATAFALGAVSEEGGPLGSRLPRSLDLALPAQSRFISARREWRPADGLMLAMEGSLGRTQATGRLLSIDKAVSSSWRLSAVADCALIRLACMGVSIDLSQPIRIERGQVTAFLADTPQGYFDPLVFSARRLDLSPSGREMDLSLMGWRSLGGLGALSLRASAVIEEGHRADAPLNLGVSAGWRRTF